MAWPEPRTCQGRWGSAITVQWCVFAAALLRIRRSAASASELAHTRVGKSSVRSESATDGGYCSQPREGNHARQQQESNLCRVDHGASAPRITVLWGGPHETRWHLETGRVHDRGYRQQRARKRVRQAGRGLSYIYGCWSRVRICDHERR